MKRCLRVVHLSASAQAIPNASFEANSFTNFPGYVSTNGSIAGWTASPANRDGLNPTTNSPIANNGAIPNGTNVAFTQSRGDLSTLPNTTTGLTVGNRHRVIFRANSRSGVGLTTNSTWSLKGGAFVSFKSSLTAIVIAQTTPAASMACSRTRTCCCIRKLGPRSRRTRSAPLPYSCFGVTNDLPAANFRTGVRRP